MACPLREEDPYNLAKFSFLAVSRGVCDGSSGLLSADLRGLIGSAMPHKLRGWVSTNDNNCEAFGDIRRNKEREVDTTMKIIISHTDYEHFSHPKFTFNECQQLLSPSYIS